MEAHEAASFPCVWPGSWKKPRMQRDVVQGSRARKRRRDKDPRLVINVPRLFQRCASMPIDTERRARRRARSGNSRRRRFSHTCASGLRIMAGCPTLRTRPVASLPSPLPPCHVHAHLAHLAKLTPSEIHNVYTHVASRRETREIGSSRDPSRTRLCMLAASVGTRRTFPASRYASPSI